jgi:hypothetical protein
MKTEIKIGQIFYVDGNMYVITKPVSEEEMKNVDCNGNIVRIVYPI